MDSLIPETVIGNLKLDEILDTSIIQRLHREIARTASLIVNCPLSQVSVIVHRPKPCAPDSPYYGGSETWITIVSLNANNMTKEYILRQGFSTDLKYYKTLKPSVRYREDLPTVQYIVERDMRACWNGLQRLLVRKMKEEKPKPRIVWNDGEFWDNGTYKY